MYANIFYIKCVKEFGLVSKYRVMDGEIHSTEVVGNVMKLDDNEQAFMDEIEIEAPSTLSRLVPQPTVYKPQTPNHGKRCRKT